MIPWADPRAGYKSRQDEIRAAIDRVLERGQYILGPEVEAFETAFADYCGVPHAVGVNTGTDALVLALRAFDIGPGDEVITVSHTALATLAAILATGATPVLVDVDPDHWTLDPAALEGAISLRTRAIVPVHLYGLPADMDPILEVASARGVLVIEDCAQAAGADYKDRRVGGLGDAGCFSFYPTKNLGAFGDAGAVVTRHAAVAARLRRLRQYGWDDRRDTVEPGVASRLGEIQAAILNVKLPTLDRDNAVRRAIAARYDAALATLPLLRPSVRPGSTHVYHLYVICCEPREALRARLAADQVLAGVHYPVPGHRHGGYGSRCRVAATGLAVTEALAECVLSLPMFPEMTAEQVGLVIQVLAREVAGLGVRRPAIPAGVSARSGSTRTT